MPGRLVLHDGVDGVVADSVLARHLVVRHAAVVKPVTPDDVLQIIVSISDVRSSRDLRHVRGPGLDARTRLRRGALHRHQDLKLAVSDVPGGVGVQGGGGVYLVTHDQRPEGLDDVAAAVKITTKLHR